MSKTKVKAEFSICGDVFDTNEITKLLGIEPAEIYLKGIISGTRKRPSTETSWSICTEKEESYDINEQTKKLLFLLIDKTDVLDRIKEKYDTTFILSLLVEIENGEKPAIYWTAETNQFLGRIGAESSVDLYIYS
ncbi:DUF4279 domain-containing protein [Pectobacterium carotovorum]|uniref:DUF4279 domain-containing protein n=1 Tax=Pectobacterium odoriferum TaxID=78398 RepID=UPI000CD27BD1|nr:DUF4279 domain-containing protein [Pectobacterium odoriferum]GKW05201.1 hypothetical protein PEC301877_40140 [Pectobacterium carotovorum subsp. carotovorum]MBA0190778.1 DUF4279 domain-containing protein [Pectobacterium odoriferum]POD89034.1 hypothetical protein BV925_23400 [Pectobacterium odoriferum]GKX45240.1 hypothetical protein SOASR015_42740 [Pectobacterium carotovorum subsp. carotovorum]GLX58983.1 hypothetical protein Pcaca02_42920 [Pectobacterium carotovorum subsp. carotovorum]